MDRRFLKKVLSGLSDKNIRFGELRNLVLNLGFDERIKGTITSLPGLALRKS